MRVDRYRYGVTSKLNYASLKYHIYIMSLGPIIPALNSTILDHLNLLKRKCQSPQSVLVMLVIVVRWDNDVIADLLLYL